MSPACVVFDFDGTLTDPSRVSEALHDATRRELASRLGARPPDVRRWWDEAIDELTQASPLDGWVYEGRVVAPLRADLYVWTNGITRAVLRRRGPAGLTAEALDSWVVSIHWAAHERTPAPFRDEAAEVVEKLVDTGCDVFVVTNSDGALVRRRLDELRARVRDRVHVLGQARKFAICPPVKPSPLFDRLPESMHVKGLGRPVLLRRGRYFEKLAELWDHCGRTAEQTLVCGDIFEIDLAMPGALGCETLLITRDETPAFERDAVAALGGGQSSPTLRALLARFGAAD